MGCGGKRTSLTIKEGFGGFLKQGNSENFNLSDFIQQEGATLLERVTPFSDYYRSSSARGEAHYLRTVTSRVSKKAKVLDHQGVEKEMWMLGSNNYLDFASHPYVIEKIKSAVDTFGAGVGGPPLLNGMSLPHRNLEQRLAKLKSQEDAMIFSSGFQANLGWVNALLRSGDHLIYDDLNHASLYDGIRMARTQHRFKATRFSHNDLNELERALKDASTSINKGAVFVAVEGVYSMDGDLAPLDRISSLCEKYNAYLIVDDAHGTGVLGANGEGTAHHFNVQNKVTLCMGTFSKTFGVTGGFLAGQQKLIDYLRFYSRSYMFSAHLAIPVVAAVDAGLDLLEKHPELILKLHENAQYLAANLRKMGYQAQTDSAIIPVPIPESVDIRAVNKRFHELGVFLNSIEFPAVSLAEQRLRVSILATLEKSELDQIIAIFHTVGKEFDLTR